MRKNIILSSILFFSIIFSSQTMALNVCPYNTDDDWHQTKEMQNVLPCYLGSYSAPNGTGFNNEGVQFYHKDKNIILTLKNNTTLPFQMQVTYYRNCSVNHAPILVRSSFILPVGSETSPTVTHSVIQSNCTIAWMEENYHYTIPNYGIVMIGNISKSGPSSSVLEQIDISGEEN